MPKLLVPAKESSAPNDPLCNFSEPAQNTPVEQQVPIEVLKQRCLNYLNYLESLEPSQANIMVRAANFTTESVLQMLQESNGSPYIRVYYGINENGEHGLFMAPIAESGHLEVTEETVFVDDCCACPPRGNCSDDELLTW